MADERYLIEIRITHDQPLEADGQTMADLAARALTDAFSADPKLLATGLVQSREAIVMDGYSWGFTDGKTTALRVIEGTLPPQYRLHAAIDLEERRRKASPSPADGVGKVYEQVVERLKRLVLVGEL